MSLIDSTAVPAVEGAPGWEFSRSTRLDLDADGETERVVLIAQVGSMNGRPIWEDAHAWQAYIEESDGRRTYVYGRLVPHGYIDILVSQADEGDAPRLLLIERMQQRMAVYGIRYAGPDDVELDVRLDEAVDPRAGILGSS